MSDKSAARGRLLSRDPARSDLIRPSFHNHRRPSRGDEKILKLSSFPKIVNKFGYPGSRFQGNKRAFNIREAASYEDHIQLSGHIPPPIGEGAGNSPEDIQEAISFIAHRNTQEILDFRQEAIARLAKRTDD